MERTAVHTYTDGNNTEKKNRSANEKLQALCTKYIHIYIEIDTRIKS